MYSPNRANRISFNMEGCEQYLLKRFSSAFQISISSFWQAKQKSTVTSDDFCTRAKVSRSSAADMVRQLACNGRPPEISGFFVNEADSGRLRAASLKNDFRQLF